MLRVFEDDYQLPTCLGIAETRVQVSRRTRSAVFAKHLLPRTRLGDLFANSRHLQLVNCMRWRDYPSHEALFLIAGCLFCI